MTDDSHTLEPRIAFVVAAGRGSIGDRQMTALAQAADLDATFIYVDKSTPWRTEVSRIARELRDADPDAAIVKGLGWRAGVAAMMANRPRHGGVPYFVTAGDSLSAFERNRGGSLRGALANAYEKTLYRRSLGFIGRTGYYVGRAVRMGAPSGVTIEGFVPPGQKVDVDRAAARAALGIDDSALVIGASGSINWSPRQRYCYGLELVNAARHVKREDVVFLIVGDGSGLPILRERAGDDARIRFTGRVPHAEMAGLMATMDATVIAQTRDENGLPRLTTKLPEYLAAGVPVLMSGVPAVHDYFDQSDADAPVQALPLHHPSTPEFAHAIARAIDGLEPEGLERRRAQALMAAERFRVDAVAGRLKPYLRNELEARAG